MKYFFMILIIWGLSFQYSNSQLFKQTYSWSFQEKAYSMDLVLNTRTYNYYKHSDKRLLFTKEVALGKFFIIKDNDNLIKMITEKLLILARKNSIAAHLMPDFATAFVQYIPYDSIKAENILSEKWSADTDLNFHYETVYINKGVCTDKSILLVSILRNLGYGAALVLMEKEKHAAAAILSPSDKSLNNSGYSYIETTAPFPIGAIPEHIDVNSIEIVQKSLGKQYSIK